VAGSGIGLFVCSSLVQAMGGRIWARRRPEGGAEFGFLLRVLEPDDDEDWSEGSAEGDGIPRMEPSVSPAGVPER
jgi:two-component system sensor histidine kinase RegB